MKSQECRVRKMEWRNRALPFPSAARSCSVLLRGKMQSTDTHPHTAQTVTSNSPRCYHPTFPGKPSSFTGLPLDQISYSEVEMVGALSACSTRLALVELQHQRWKASLQTCQPHLSSPCWKHRLQLGTAFQREWRTQEDTAMITCTDLKRDV